MTAARCLWCSRSFIGTPEQVHELYTTHDCYQIAASGPPPGPTQAAPLHPTTHGSTSGERGELFRWIGARNTRPLRWEASRG